MSKKVEIDEAEVSALRRAAKVLQELNAKPESRKHLEKGLKVINPDLETEEDVAARLAAPHLAQIEAANKRAEALEKRLDDADKAAREAADAAKVTKALSWLDDQNYTDEGKAEIKKIMEAELIPNVEAAAALFEKRNPKPVSVPGANYESDSWNLRGDTKDDNLKELFTNEDAWGDKEAARTLNDIRRAQVNQAA